MNSACCEYKPSVDTMPKGLAEFNEVIGVLLKVVELDGTAVAVFECGEFSLPIELAKKLRELQGKKIGILRLNGYHVCEMEATLSCLVEGGNNDHRQL